MATQQRGAKISRAVDNKVTLYKNCIINQGKQTLFFLVNLYNYNMYTSNSIENQLDQFYNLIVNIENSFPSLKFSVLSFNDIISPSKYVDSFIKTVRLWNPDFVPTDAFLNNVHSLSKNYCFLAINIDEKKNFDFNEVTIGGLIKESKDKVLDLFANYEQQSIDTKKIDDISTTIDNLGQLMIKPAPEEIVLAYYLGRVFPSYSLVVGEDEDYYQNKAIISYLQQEFIPYFNYFEMTNQGVELFNVQRKTTYGCVIDIIEFPMEVTDFFSLQHPELIVNCQTMSKRQAVVEFSRARADLRYEEETAAVAAADTGDVNFELSDYHDLAELGRAGAETGKKIVKADIHILVLANSKEKLDRERTRLISMLKEQNIIATFASEQAKTYVNSFIRLRPTNYPFLMDLRYPLTFRLNQGNAICDVDSQFTAPVIGHYVNVSEATS